jgi:hypothetical protein
VVEGGACWNCEEAETVALPSGETFVLCSPAKWKSPKCADKLLASKKRRSESRKPPWLLRLILFRVFALRRTSVR